MIHVVKPEGKARRGKRYLMINPPLQEPYRRLLRQPSDANSDRADREGDATNIYYGRSYVLPLPIGLLRIAGQLLREGNEIYFLDCFSSASGYPNFHSRQTPSDVPDAMLTDRYEVRTFHLGLRYDELGKLLTHVTADEIWIGCTFTYQNEPAHRVIDLCREHLPRTPVRLGGIYPTLAPDVARSSGADEVFTGPFPGIEDESLNYDFLGTPPQFILIKGTSGCPNRCAYCAVHKLEGNRFHHRDPDDVFREIARAHERYGLHRLGMWDSNILMQYEEYLGVILRRIIDAGLDMRISAPEGLDYRLLTPGVARDLRNAGFRRVDLAVENIDSSYTKDVLNRRNNIKRLKDAVAYLKAAGFKGPCIRIFIIVGMPDQTIENVIENILFVWSVGCNATLFPFTPIPGTPFYDNGPAELRQRKLSALHPSLYPCVEDNRTKNMLIELTDLMTFSGEERSQADNFREVIHSEELVRMLSQ